MAQEQFDLQLVRHESLTSHGLLSHCQSLPSSITNIPRQPALFGHFPCPLRLPRNGFILRWLRSEIFMFWTSGSRQFLLLRYLDKCQSCECFLSSIHVSFIRENCLHIYSLDYWNQYCVFPKYSHRNLVMPIFVFSWKRCCYCDFRAQTEIKWKVWKFYILWSI